MLGTVDRREVPVRELVFGWLELDKFEVFDLRLLVHAELDFDVLELVTLDLLKFELA